MTLPSSTNLYTLSMYIFIIPTTKSGITGCFFGVSIHSSKLGDVVDFWFLIFYKSNNICLLTAHVISMTLPSSTNLYTLSMYIFYSSQSLVGRHEVFLCISIHSFDRWHGQSWILYYIVLSKSFALDSTDEFHHISLSNMSPHLIHAHILFILPVGHHEVFLGVSAHSFDWQHGRLFVTLIYSLLSSSFSLSIAWMISTTLATSTYLTPYPCPYVNSNHIMRFCCPHLIEASKKNLQATSIEPRVFRSGY